MRRGLVAIILVATGASGCSLIVDFDKPPPDAGIDPLLCMYGEPNETRAAAAPILTTDTGPAAVCSDAVAQDFDFYSVALPANTGVRFAVTFTADGGRGDLDLFLFDANGTLLGSAVTFGDNETLDCPTAGPPSCPTLAEGTYVFEVRGATPTVINTYNFALTIN
jgi:hypothetical protein